MTKIVCRNSWGSEVSYIERSRKAAEYIMKEYYKAIVNEARWDGIYKDSYHSPTYAYVDRYVEGRMEWRIVD